MSPNKVYIVAEGQRGDPAYAIHTKSTWAREADVPQFHVMKTMEIVSRTLIVHIHQIKEAPVEKPKANHKNGA